MPDYGVDDVADHALALLLACARRVPESDRAIRAGAWPSYAELAPMYRLRGRTLGVIGYGRIGRKVAEKGRAFGLRVSSTTRSSTDDRSTATSSSASRTSSRSTCP